MRHASFARFAVLCILAVVAMVGCKENTPLKVERANFADGAIGISVDRPVLTFYFNMEVSRDRENLNKVSLLQGGTAVPGVVTFGSEGGISFRPDARLDYNKVYEFRADRGIAGYSPDTGSAARTLGSAVIYKFTTEGSTSGWDVPLTVSVGTVRGNNPRIGFDNSGNAIAVWTEIASGRHNIWGNRYTVTGGWGTPSLIDTEDLGDAYNPRIAVAPNGDAHVVWYQHDGTRYNIWANRYTAGAGWGGATLIESDDVSNASKPRIAIDAAGNAVAAWTQNDGTRDNIKANRYAVGAGWGTASLIETSDAGEATELSLAIDSTTGHAIAVWAHDDGTRYNIMTNRYVVGTGWGTAALIETDNAGGARKPEIAIDSTGNAIAVWHQNDGTRDNIWANRYTAGTGWGTAAKIESADAASAQDPHVAFAPNGNGMAVWSYQTGAQAARYIK